MDNQPESVEAIPAQDVAVHPQSIPTGGVRKPVSAVQPDANTVIEPHAPINWVEAIPYWFAAAAAIVYATGFLIEFTFLGSFGIREAATDIFKAKYIYNGLLCLMFPASLCVVFVRYYRDRTNEAPRKAGFSSFLLILSLYSAFYILIAFAPGGLFEAHHGEIAFLFCFNMVGIMLTHDTEEALNTKIRLINIKKATELPDAFWTKLWLWTRRCMLLFSVGLIVHIFWNVWGLLWTMIKEGAWLYFAFVLSTIFILWRASKSISRGKSRVISFCHAVVYTYLSIIIFAHRVYPFIPFNRGGGDYSRGGVLSTLTFDSHFLGSIPPEIIGSIRSHAAPSQLVQPKNPPGADIQSTPVVILSESPEAYFILVPKHVHNEVKLIRDLERLRKPGPRNKPTQIYVIRRDLVTGVMHNSI